MSLRVKVYVFLAAAALLICGGYLGNRYYLQAKTAEASSTSGAAPAKNASDSSADETATPVELAATEKKTVSAQVTGTANLRPLRLIQVATQAEGVVIEILAEEGDYVERGQPLCRLDGRDLEIRLVLTEERLAQARLQLEKSGIRREKAQVQIENSKAELQRQEEAYAEKLVSEREVAELRYRLDELRHDERIAASEVREFTHRLEELQAEISQVKLELSRKQILAPFSGRITERTVQLGQTVRQLDSLFRLGAFSPLYADVHLAELEALRVHSGQKAIVSLGRGGSAQSVGYVERISPVVDPATGTVKVTVRVEPSAQELKPGAFVRVSIETDRRAEAVLIPKRAIVEEDGETFVFIAEGETAHRRPVVLGYETESEIEVQQGVTPGEKVVVAGQGKLKDGAKIREITS